MNINSFYDNPFPNICVICDNIIGYTKEEVTLITIECMQSLLQSIEDKYLIFHYCNEHFPYHISLIDLSVLNSKFELIKKYTKPFDEDLKNTIIRDFKKLELLK